MAIFRPPTDAFLNLANMDLDVRWTERGRLAHALFKHFDNLPVGRNIYRLKNGVYVENEPAVWDDIDKIYYGGHDYEVTDDEVVELTAAGYGAYIT